MAIINRIPTNPASQIKKNNESKETDKSQSKISSSDKKSGFVASTFKELSKVEWPSWKYVLTWSAVIILFTGIFSIILGFADHTFSSSLLYSDCVGKSVKQESNDSIGNCTERYFQTLTYQRALTTE